jgi:hypothetical protein
VKDQFDGTFNGIVVGASITGPGTLGIDTTVDGSSASLGRSITSTWADNIGEVTVFSDGSAGTGVITITATTAALVTTVLGTKTVKFAGSASKATVTQNLFVAAAGTVLGLSPATTKAAAATTVATTPALTVEVLDSTGTAVVAGAIVKITSSDSTVIVAGTCVELSVDGDPVTAAAPPPEVPLPVV